MVGSSVVLYLKLHPGTRQARVGPQQSEATILQYPNVTDLASSRTSDPTVPLLVNLGRSFNITD